MLFLKICNRPLSARQHLRIWARPVMTALCICVDVDVYLCIWYLVVLLPFPRASNSPLSARIWVRPVKPPFRICFDVVCICVFVYLVYSSSIAVFPKGKHQATVCQDMGQTSHAAISYLFWCSLRIWVRPVKPAAVGCFDVVCICVFVYLVYLKGKQQSGDMGQTSQAAILYLFWCTLICFDVVCICVSVYLVFLKGRQQSGDMGQPDPSGQVLWVVLL